MNPDNPYAAPQAALEQYHEPELLAGELPFFADRLAFQEGAARAREALGNAVALVLLAFVLALLFNAFLAIDAVGILFSVATVLIAQRIGWKFYTGLSQMAAASRLFLQTLLNVARFAFLVGWVCYALKLAVAIFLMPAGRAVYGCCEVLDNLAGAAVAVTIGLAALRLGGELQQSVLRRGAWLSMIFLGGSHLLILLLDAVLFLRHVIAQPLGLASWGETLFLLVWVAVVWFLIGYFVLMRLLTHLSQLPIRSESTLPPLAETVLDQETIARRRRMAEGQG